jgi:imidazolonepropionase
VPKTLFTNIGSLVMPAAEVGVLETMSNAAFVVEDGLISWVGEADSAPRSDSVVDVAGACVIPGFVDSHAHLMFAGSREQEFAARMAGVSYSAGGIKTTVAKTRAATDSELRANAQKLISEFYQSGVTHFEIKSGYGLDVETEVRSLKIAREFTEDTTFLGAHVVPADQDPDAYV